MKAEIAARVAKLFYFPIAVPSLLFAPYTIHYMLHFTYLKSIQFIQIGHLEIQKRKSQHASVAITHIVKFYLGKKMSYA